MSDEIKQFLTDVDYPNVDSLNEDDIFSLFSKENISKFYRWFVGELLSDQTMVSDCNDSEIIDLLCKFGYCKKRQIEDILKGSLNFEEQHVLISGMLNSLSNIKKSSRQDASEPVTIDELNAQLTQKFKSILDISVIDVDKIGEQDFEEHATTLEEQIQELEERLKAADDESQSDTDNIKTFDKNNVSDTEELEELPTVINKFLLSTSNLSNVQNNIDEANKSKVTGKFSEEFTKRLVECSKDILDLEEYFTNLNIVEELNGDITPIEATESSECAESVEKLLKLVETL